jgi:hypothetical protein
VQAFILSHEMSEPKDMDTYLARTLSPLRPMISFGRAAKAQPECKPDECVWYWWKDIYGMQPHIQISVLPVCLSPGTTLSLLLVLPHNTGGYSMSTMLHIDAITCGNHVKDVLRALQVRIRQVMIGMY